MIGEIGLDFHWVEDRSCYPAQVQVLEFFLAAAQEQQKIVNLHTKGAEAEILQLLDRYQISRAIIHWYSGPLDVFQALVSRGYYFTIGVEVRSSPHIQALTQALPLSQLLTETDNPGGAKWLTGTIGMPALLYDVLRMIATLKGTTEDRVSEAVQKNFQQMVENDPWWTRVQR
jgi:TatD DNase family protein